MTKSDLAHMLESSLDAYGLCNDTIDEFVNTIHNEFVDTNSNTPKNYD